MGRRKWMPLTPAGMQLRSQVHGLYTKTLELLNALLHGQPNVVRSRIEKLDAIVRPTIEQSELARGTLEKIHKEAKQALSEMLALLASVYSQRSDERVFVPDTNALIWNPRLEDWRFEDGTFVLVLVPTVISELDELKMERRNESLRQKAETLIRQIKEYRGRGQLTDGVVLVRGVSTIRGVAAEPRFSDSLPRLDPQNPDDRILASFIEVMRMHPRSQVTLVTRDLNLQTKAELARIPFTEPPDPATPQPTT